MENDQTWKESSKPLKTLNIEIYFLLQDDFHAGNPNFREENTDPTHVEPLSLPDFARASEKCATTAEVLGNEAQLVAYYRQIVERGATIGRSFNDLRSYFWLRLCLWNEEEGVSISFPWYDSFTEIQRFTNWLACSQEEVFWDIDQGWQLDAVKSLGVLYIRQTNPDSDETHENLKAPHGDIAASAKRVESRAQLIIERLTEGVGVDVWSGFIKDAAFGTSDWQPEHSINRTQNRHGFFKSLYARWADYLKR